MGLLALFLALSLGLGGCAPIFQKKTPENGGGSVQTSGGQANVDSQGRPFETVYKADIFSFDRPVSPAAQVLPSPGGVYVLDPFGQDETLREFDAEGRCLRELGDTRPEWVGPDGSAWRLEYKEDRSDRHTDYAVYRAGEAEPILRFTTEQGTAEMTAGDGFLLITRQWWDESNTGHYSMSVYNLAGQLLNEQPLNQWFQLYRDGGELYFFGRESYELFRLDGQNFSLNKVDSLREDESLNGISGGLLYSNDGTCVYSRPVGGAEREALFRYDALYLTPGLAPIPIGDSGCFLFHEITNEVSPYKIARPVDKNAVPAARQTVVLACNDPEAASFNRPYPSSFWEAIADFNTASRDYEVVVKNYADCPDPQTALNADLAAGEAPDLIDLAGFSAGLATAANAEDLLPYVERDLGGDVLLPGPLKAMETDGKLFSLMPSFTVQALLVPAALVNGQDTGSWAALSALAGGAEHVFYDSVSQGDLLKAVFAGGQRDYTAEQATDILAFAAALPEQALQNPYDLPQEQLEQMAEEGTFFELDRRPILAGEQSFELAEVSGPVIPQSNGEDYTAVGLGYEEGVFGQKLAALPLPGRSGFDLCPAQELMMPLKAGNKEGAWAFIQFTLQDRYLTDMSYGMGFRRGIPLTRSAYEQGARAWEKLDGVISGSADGVDYSLTYDPANCEALFRQLLDGAEGVQRGPDELYTAVEGLAASYFAGEKSLDQAAEDIASRLAVYRAEHS